MAKDTKLRSMLHRKQGRDFRLEKQKKRDKDAKKQKELKKASMIEELEDEEDEDEGDEEISDAEDPGKLGAHALNGAKKIPKSGVKLDGNDDGADDDDDDWEDEDSEDNAIVASRLDDSDSSSSENEDDEEADAASQNEEDIPFSDLDSLASEDRGDIIPHQKLTINNKPALLSALHRIQLPLSTLPFSAHQSITSQDPIEIADVDDDLSRELAFYKQSLGAAVSARALFKKEGVSFTRPNDYFAEMVKSDEHMGKIKQKLMDEAASKKAAAEARKQRDLKKFGKQVQIAKLQERQKAKRETLEKISALKRKRSNAPLTNENEEDLFDVTLDNEVERPAKKARESGDRGQPNFKRQKKNEKYGFGGKKRHAKSGDAFSTSDMRDYPGAKRMKQNFGGKGGATKNRPGKARRAKGRL